MSIEAQRRECQAYAERNGYNVYNVYIDRARSGTTDERAAFLEMIAEASGKKPAFEVVLVHKLDRFARNRYDSIKYKYILRRKGIRVISVTQPIIGSGDPTEVILESVLEGMDEFYSLNLARESLKGMSEVARRGWYTGGNPPFGYTLERIRTEKGPKQKLKINEAEAKTVRKIFNMYLAGIGIQAIRRKLNLTGVTLRRGRPFAKNVITNILQNEKYVGDTVFGKRLNRAKRPFNFKFEPIRVKDTHPPIIRREKWEKVQEIMTGRGPGKKHPRAVASEYLFSGIMTCGLCGFHFVGKTAHGRNGRYRYYTCGRNNHYGPGSCPQKSYNADRIEPLIVGRLRDAMLNEDNLIRMIEAFNDTLAASKKDRKHIEKRLSAEIEAIARKKSRLFDFIEAGKGLSHTDIAPRIQELTERESDLTLELQKVQAQLSAKPIKVRPILIKEWIQTIADLFEDVSFWKDKGLVQEFITGIRIGDADIEITYNPSIAADPDRISAAPGSGPGPDQVRIWTRPGSHLRFMRTGKLVIPLIRQISFSRPERLSRALYRPGYEEGSRN